MADLKLNKVNTLPAILEANNIYFEDNGERTDGYVSDNAGSSAKRIGYYPLLFQARKTSTQATTTAFTDITNWDEVDVSDAIYSWNAVAGILTINDTGFFEVSAHELCDLIANNRSEIAIKLVDSSGDVAGALDRQYAMRNASQDEGSCQFSSFIYSVSTSGETLKIQEQRVGSTANIISARITVKKVS